MRWFVGTGVALSSAALVAAAACSDNGDEALPSDRRGSPSAADATPSVDASVGDVSTLSVELGTGSSLFVPLRDGEGVILVRGNQGYQHIWTSVRVAQSSVHEAIVTLSSRRIDGQWSGPTSTAAVELGPIDGGIGTEKIGLTALLDYGAIGKELVVRVEVKTPSGLFGADERTIRVLSPSYGRCTLDGGTTTCNELCGELTCALCETGSTSTGYLHDVDASEAAISSCTSAFSLDATHDYACCCCR